jgi:hypothetical protein
MGLMRPLATNSYPANRRAWSTIARSGSRLKADMWPMPTYQYRCDKCGKNLSLPTGKVARWSRKHHFS